MTVPMAPARTESPQKAHGITLQVTDSRLSSLQGRAPGLPKRSDRTSSGTGCPGAATTLVSPRCHPGPKNTKQREWLCSLPGPN